MHTAEFVAFACFKCSGSMFSSSTAGFNCGDGSEIRWDLVHFECLHLQLHQANEWTTKIRLLPAAAIRDHTDRRDQSAVAVYDFDRLLDTTSPGYDVLGDDELLVRRNGETASKNEPVTPFFGKNVTLAERASHFLADNDSTESGGDHAIASNVAEPICQQSANTRRKIRMLQQQRALKELPAVQSGAEHEMAIEQRARFVK
jgi:hypothetical protein